MRLPKRNNVNSTINGHKLALLLLLHLLSLPAESITNQGVVDLTTCGVKKGCFLHPATTCTTTSHPTNTSCTYLATYEALGGNKMRLEMAATLPSSSPGYVALALSSDKTMGDDSVIACILLGSNGASASTAISVYYNTPEKESQPLSNRLESLSGFESSYQDGVLHCSVTRDVITNNQLIYNLTGSWYLMLAKGAFDVLTGKLTKHVVEPVISTLPVRMVQPSHVTPITTSTISSTSPSTSTSISPPSSTSPTPSTPHSTTGIPTMIGCGVYKVCLSYPPHLVTLESSVDEGNIRHLLVSMSTDISSLSATASGYYMAMGLSDDWKMGNDSVLVCVSNANTVRSYFYFNSNYNTIRVDQATSYLHDSKGGILSDGRLWCSFTRPLTLHPPPNVNFMLFNVTQHQMWYILVARGLAQDDTPLRHGMSPLPLVTHCPVNLFIPGLVNAYPAVRESSGQPPQTCYLSHPEPPRATSTSSSATSSPATSSPLDTSPATPTSATSPATSFPPPSYFPHSGVATAAWPPLTGNWRYYVALLLLLPNLIAFIRRTMLRNRLLD